MGKLAAAALALLLTVTTAKGAADDDLAAKVHDSLRKAKNKEQVESILAFCRAQIRLMTFRQHNQALVAALKAMEQNDVEQANNHLRRARQLDELDDNLGAITCRNDDAPQPIKPRPPLSLLPQ